MAQFLVIFAVLLVVVAVLSQPLRRLADGRPRAPEDTRHEVRMAELEAAREAKYREIRDAELDHETGKLSDDDYAALDQALRAEAVEILHALDREESARGAGEFAPANSP